MRTSSEAVFFTVWHFTVNASVVVVRLAMQGRANARKYMSCQWRVVQVEYSCASLQEARVRQTTIYFFASFSDALETTKATRK